MIKPWRTYLLVLSGLTVLTGLEFAFAQGLGPMQWMIETIRGQLLGTTEVSPAAEAIESLYFAFIGAVTVGMGVLAFAIAYGPFARGDRWAWNALAAGIGAWYVVDTTVAIVHGVTFPVIFNTVFLLAFELPLIATYRAFHPRTSGRHAATLG